VAPLLVEKALAAPLEQADRGIYRIGLALQLIDDLTTFLLRYPGQPVTTIWFPQSALKARLLNRNGSIGSSGGRSGKAVHRVGLCSVGAAVMERAIGEALAGFESDCTVQGFWIDRRIALILIRYLFRLRGVPNLLACCRRKVTLHFASMATETIKPTGMEGADEVPVSPMPRWQCAMSGVTGAGLCLPSWLFPSGCSSLIVFPGPQGWLHREMTDGTVLLESGSLQVHAAGFETNLAALRPIEEPAKVESAFAPRVSLPSAGGSGRRPCCCPAG